MDLFLINSGNDFSLSLSPDIPDLWPSPSVSTVVG